jgi:hypothetical protein
VRASWASRPILYARAAMAEGFKRSLRLPRIRLDLADLAVLAIFAGLVIGVVELTYLVGWWAGLALAALLLVIWGMRVLLTMSP